jgi:GDP-D-mannose 3',5'-epimerase
MKKVLVCGAGGFIGTHLVSFLKKQGNFVIGVDITNPKYSQTDADQFYNLDLRDAANVVKIVTPDIYEIYQLAADMGGAGYIFTGNNDADIMSNSVLINLNILKEMVRKNVTRVFFSSSACIYPSFNQTDPNNPLCSESSAYPANPDSEYGWEKLFSERLYLSYARNYNLHVRIARFHNIYGPLGSFNNGKEKAPAALCRKIATAKNNATIDIWGPGTQTRSFLYIDECIRGIQKIMESNYNLPINLGSSRMISINDLAILISKIANKTIKIKNIPGPIGVMGRNSNNTLIQNELNWTPDEDLVYGLTQTYNWILSKL